MALHKIIKYIALALALIAGVFFIITLSTGDDAIKDNIDNAQNSTIVPMMYLAYIVIAFIIGLVLIYVVKNLFSSPAALKKSLISIGIMFVVCLLAYFVFADDNIINPITGEPYVLDDGKLLTTGSSKLVGASIITFYIIAVLAIASILWTGISKLLNR